MDAAGIAKIIAEALQDHGYRDQPDYDETEDGRVVRDGMWIDVPQQDGSVRCFHVGVQDVTGR